MHRRVARSSALALWLAFSTFLSAAFLPAVASAQIRIVTPAASVSGVDVVLQRGADLEGQRRWGDALTCYEEALRETPDDARLHQRHDLAKIHYDLGRRYHDTSFRRDVLALATSEALDTYSEVLLKIDSHYVVGVDWQQLVDMGTRCVEIAVTEPCFVETHLKQVDAQRVTAFQQHLSELMRQQTVHSRQDARAAVTAAADLADRELGIPQTAVVFEYLSGAVDGLDAYSSYLTRDQLRDVYAQIDGNFVGLGVELKADAGTLLIVNVIAGSPADQAGIHGGDRVLAVGNQSTRGLTTDEAASLLQGPEDSVAALQVVTGDHPPRLLQIRRQHIEVASIEGVKIVDANSGVAYLKINSFQRNTSRDLDAALWKLQQLGMRSLIIDLRGNPGGLLNMSVEVADRFISQGTIVSTRGRSRMEDYDYTARQQAVWRMPLVLLIDSQSASASEILAAAVRDHGRGTIVGRKSYGKGSVQGIFPLASAGSGLRLTTAKFYGPSGRPISNVGVTPDVLVQTTAKPNNDGLIPSGAPDEALNAAVQTARNNLAQR